MREFEFDTIKLLIEYRALIFGKFTLKSGRQSPYFLNIGAVAYGEGISALGDILAEKVVTDIGLDTFDVIFGPAYKGITLASAAASSLYRESGVNKGIAYDRKEAKKHGEGGNFIGAELSDVRKKVLIIDDVITDGQTKIDTIRKIEGKTKAEVTGMLVVMDRMERDINDELFSKIIADKTGVPIFPVITLENVLFYIDEVGEEAVGIDEYVFEELMGLLPNRE